MGSMLRQVMGVCLLTASVTAQGGGLGLFTNAGDVGGPAIKGSAAFDATSREYRITGSGANIWAKQDQFQYVWREMTGDFTFTTTLRFEGQGAEHRKAGIMVRQSLDTDAVYADVVVHGNGMPALQWRSKKGDDTNTFDLPIVGPGTFTLKMVRTGVKTYLYVGREGADPKEIVHTEVAMTGTRAGRPGRLPRTMRPCRKPSRSRTSRSRGRHPQPPRPRKGSGASPPGDE